MTVVRFLVTQALFKNLSVKHRYTNSRSGFKILRHLSLFSVFMLHAQRYEIRAPQLWGSFLPYPKSIIFRRYTSTLLSKSNSKMWCWFFQAFSNLLACLFLRPPPVHRPLPSPPSPHPLVSDKVLHTVSLGAGVAPVGSSVGMCARCTYFIITFPPQPRLSEETWHFLQLSAKCQALHFKYLISGA